MARTVLVVDDDPSVLEVIAGMLEYLGCDVVTAENGLDALDQLNRNQRIAILITDINMPGMDGHELAERAIKISPELQIIQLSGRELTRWLPNDHEALLRGRSGQHHATPTGLC